MLKELIKELSEAQVELKKQRKTGPYTLERNSWGGVDYSKVPEKVVASWRAAGEVQRNKVRITAALNLYHELRGSDYRHNIPENDFYYSVMYEGELEQLHEKLTRQSESRPDFSGLGGLTS